MRETGCKITKKNRNEEHFFLPFLFLNSIFFKPH